MKVGRPEKYDKNKHVQIARLCALAGFTDEQIAEEIGIVKSTLYEWKLKYKEFSDALRENKEIHDSQVEMSLLQRAKGIVVKEKIIDEKGNEVVKIKELPPDATSMIFWLKNRQPKKWRDTKSVDFDGEDLNVKIEIIGK